MKRLVDMTNEELAEIIVADRISHGQFTEADRDWLIERELRESRESLENGVTAILHWDEEKKEETYAAMTKSELAEILIKTMIDCDIIGVPADMADLIKYYVNNNTKKELVEKIASFNTAPGCEESWIEWSVIYGEMEPLDYHCKDDSDNASPVWAWVPDYSCELDGEYSGLSYNEAKKIFDSISPIGIWFSHRWEEVQNGESPCLGRRIEVILSCQVCYYDKYHRVVCVNDDIMSRKKTFDIYGDYSAKILCSALLHNI